MFKILESPIHLIIVLAVVLLFFGAKRVPELAKGLGAGVRELRKGAQGEGDEDARGALDEGEEGSDPASAAGHRIYASNRAEGRRPANFALTEF